MAFQALKRIKFYSTEEIEAISSRVQEIREQHEEYSKKRVIKPELENLPDFIWKILCRFLNTNERRSLMLTCTSLCRVLNNSTLQFNITPTHVLTDIPPITTTHVKDIAVGSVLVIRCHDRIGFVTVKTIGTKCITAFFTFPSVDKRFYDGFLNKNATRFAIRPTDQISEIKYRFEYRLINQYEYIIFCQRFVEVICRYDAQTFYIV